MSADPWSEADADAMDLANGIADAQSDGRLHGYRGYPMRPRDVFDTDAEHAAYVEAYADGEAQAEENAEERRNEERWGSWCEQHGRGKWNSL